MGVFGAYNNASIPRFGTQLNSVTLNGNFDIRDLYDDFVVSNFPGYECKIVL